MLANQFNLLNTRRFLPLFITQFLGAFNDNVFKNALVIFITYTFANQFKLNPEIIITLAAGIFILPFFLFSATAGQLADKYEKSRLIRYTKMAEIVLMFLAGIGLYTENVTFLMIILFLIGTQATFFGPMKYSILPDHLQTEELIAGNGLLEAGTYLAILLGTMVGGVLAIFHVGPLLVFIMIVITAIAGFVASKRIPAAEAAVPHLAINYNIARETLSIVRYTLRDKKLSLAIMGISWFWLIGATYLSQFPTYTKNILGAQSSVVTVFLTAFTLGIGVGSLLCNRLLKGKIHATFVPLAALGMTVFSIDLVMASQHIITKTGKLVTLMTFLSFLPDWHILLDLFLIAMCGGIYVVPLYTILQNESEPSHRSRAVACNNIMNALFMVVAALGTTIMFFLHFSVTQVFFVVALANFAMAIYICKLLPEEFIRSSLIWIFKLFYRIEVKGMNNYIKAGKRVVIVTNHSSFLDALLLAVFLPDRLTFAVHAGVVQKSWFKWLFKLVNIHIVNSANPLTLRTLVSGLRMHQHVVIFPEGEKGGLKNYIISGVIAEKAGAKLLPIHIASQKHGWMTRMTIAILEPISLDFPEAAKGYNRRQQIGQKIYQILQ